MMAGTAHWGKRRFSLGRIRSNSSKAEPSQGVSNLEGEIGKTGKIRVLRLKSKPKSEDKAYAKLPPLSTSLPSSPQGKYLHRIDTFLTSLPGPKPSITPDFQKSRKLIGVEIANIKKTLTTAKYRPFSKTRKKLLEEEVVLSKAKIRMMLIDLKVRLRQARSIVDSAYT